MMKFEALAQAVIEGDDVTVSELVRRGLDKGVPAETIISEGLTPGITQVGELFHEGEYFLPDMLLSARAMQAGISILRPILAQRNYEAIATVVLGTVQGDIHDIGKNIVGMMMKGAGFNVIDLGQDVPAGHFVEAVQEHKPEILGLSALLSTTMPAMRTVLEALQEAGLRDEVKVMVGGAPVTQEYADNIGADGYACDAAEAVKRARSLLGLD